MQWRSRVILAGAFLLGATLQRRVQQASELTPSQSEELAKRAGGCTRNETVKQQVAQAGLAEALVEKNLHIPWAGKVEDALEEAGPLADDMQQSPKTIPQRKVIKGREKQYKGKDSGEVKVGDQGNNKSRSEGEDKEQNSGQTGDEQGRRRIREARREGRRRDRERRARIKETLAEAVQSVQKAANPLRKLIGESTGGERSDTRLRFPVLKGSWRVTRLAFAHRQFSGFIYQDIPSSKILLIKCWEAVQEFGGEVIISPWGNDVRARIGDKITFDVDSLAQEGEGKPRPMASNVIVRQRGSVIGEGSDKVPPPADVRTQVLYYISDENLRTDRFFQDIIAATKGGWISTDFLLSCRRLRQLGATAKLIIKCLKDAPGVEVRNMPGQEAIRRTRPLPPLEPTVAATQSAANVIARRSAQAPVLVAKKIYGKEMIKHVGALASRKAGRAAAAERAKTAAVVNHAIDWVNKEVGGNFPPYLGKNSALVVPEAPIRIAHQALLKTLGMKSQDAKTAGIVTFWLDGNSSWSILRNGLVLVRGRLYLDRMETMIQISREELGAQAEALMATMIDLSPSATDKSLMVMSPRVQDNLRQAWGRQPRGLLDALSSETEADVKKLLNQKMFGRSGVFKSREERFFALEKPIKDAHLAMLKTLGMNSQEAKIAGIRTSWLDSNFRWSIVRHGTVLVRGRLHLDSLKMMIQISRQALGVQAGALMATMMDLSCTRKKWHKSKSLIVIPSVEDNLVELWGRRTGDM